MMSSRHFVLLLALLPAACTAQTGNGSGEMTGAADSIVSPRVCNPANPGAGCAGPAKTPENHTTAMDKVHKTDAEWRAMLSPEVYRIAREKGTERAFTGAYYDVKTKGTFNCACCGQPLFDGEHKYDSGSGWPSFWQPAAPAAVGEHTDHSHGMTRTEVVCSRCDAHLGHVFTDGPKPTGLRYCINSASLKLDDSAQPKP